MIRTHGSLFSGVGGFDISAEWMGWTNVFHCEINDFCNQVLNYYWPNAEKFKDIKTTDFSKFRGAIDVVSAGFPCQPWSAAGKRKGKADDRHLWPYVPVALRQIQPRWFLGENVSGLLNWSGGMVLDEIKTDLETAGFEVFPPLVLPACGVNAPHRRDRVFIVAHSRSNGQQSGKSSKDRQAKKKSEGQGLQWQRIWSDIRRTGEQGIVADADEQRLEGRPRSAKRKGNISTERSGLDWTTADAAAIRMEGNGSYWQQEPQAYAKERLLMRSSAGNYWSEWPTQSALCERTNGLSSRLAGITVPNKRGGVRILNEKQTYGRHRNESLKAFGNSVVPQLIYQIYQAIETYERICNQA